MKASIIAVGTELLFGQTINSNAAYISRELQDLNVDVMYHYTVGDNPNRLKETINLAMKDCDLIITTGGLGPTQDDLTKEIICEVMDVELILNEELLSNMKDFFKKLNRPMTKNNEKQCFVPKDSFVFKNERGTAPGFAIEKDGKIVVALPGPPREMTHMFQTGLKPILEKKSGNVMHYKIIRTIGIGESALETEIVDLIEDETANATIATYAKTGECSLRVAAKMETMQKAVEEVDAAIFKIKERIGQYIYSLEDEELKTVIVKKMIEKNIVISCAESCTGGKFASAITDVPGSSKVFDRGIVTYSNESKIKELGVLHETIEIYGAVSEECAKEMAEGLHKKTNSDICISITGIAGPDGGTEEKPVGTVFMAISYNNKIYTHKHRLINTGRDAIRTSAVLQMLSFVNRVIS